MAKKRRASQTEEVKKARDFNTGEGRRRRKRVEGALDEMKKARKSLPGGTRKQAERARRTHLAESRARRRGR
jgi:hypothetical protein